MAISGILRDPEVANICCLHLGPDGLIGAHPATTPQSLLIVQGSGEVRGDAPDFASITAGHTAFWETGEVHETHSKEGITAIVIEEPTLNPSAVLVEVA